MIWPSSPGVCGGVTTQGSWNQHISSYWGTGDRIPIIYRRRAVVENMSRLRTGAGVGSNIIQGIKQMGYHLRILRDSTRPSISDEEFVAAVKRIRELELECDGVTARFVAKGQLQSTLQLEDGEVWTNNAERATLDLMLKLAKILDSRVRGDAGESYRSGSETYVHPDDEGDVSIQEELISTAKQKRLLINVIKVFLLIIVGGLFFYRHIWND